MKLPKILSSLSVYLLLLPTGLSRDTKSSNLNKSNGLSNESNKEPEYPKEEYNPLGPKVLCAFL